MSEMTICDFFIIIPLGNKKAPPTLGGARKKRRQNRLLNLINIIQKLAKKSIEKIDFSKYQKNYQVLA